ncbi:MAG: hypothetical protein IMX00_05215 [Limnochordales bacterium]|nr:hypothetical protein [Limnochordales bacterium]
MNEKGSDRLAVDPRPDLAVDHALWAQVLATARTEAPSVLGLLHGLRCLGAVLRKQSGSRGPYLRLDYHVACREIVDSETGSLLWCPQPREIREVWLEPHRQEISRLFQAVVRRLNP